MKRLFLFWTVVLLSIGAWPQNVRYDSQVLGSKGPVPAARIAVCTQPASTGNQPCTPLAALCSSLTDATCTSTNPVTADPYGNFHFYVKQSELPVTVQIYGPDVATQFVMTDQLAQAGSNVTGGTCSNQTVTAIAASTGVPTCTTVTSAYVDTSIAKTGTDINTSNQVTSLHLAVPPGCTNQVLSGLTAGGAPNSCVTVTSAYVDSSIAKTGTDINTSNQVSGLHLGGFNPVLLGSTETIWTNGSGLGTLPNAPSAEATPAFSGNTGVTATTVATVGSTAQFFIIGGYLAQTSLGSGCTGASSASVNVIYTDADTGASNTFTVSATLSFATSGSLKATDTATGNLIHAKAGTNIQYSVSFTPGSGCTTNPSYNAYVLLRAL